MEKCHAEKNTQRKHISAAVKQRKHKQKTVDVSRYILRTIIDQNQSTVISSLCLIYILWNAMI